MKSDKPREFHKRIIVRLLNKVGIAAFEKKPGYSYLDKRLYEYQRKNSIIKLKPGYSYVPDYFKTTRHKQIDIRKLQGFGQLAKEVSDQDKTLLGYDRLYIIYQLLQSLKRFVDQPERINVAEVGVYNGGSSYFIASCALAIELNITLHGFDTFYGHRSEDILPNVDDENKHKAGLFNDTDFMEVSEYLRKFENVRLFQGRFQDTCMHVEQERFQFVHLDVDLYDPILYALNFFSKRLVSKGIIVVDDYGNRNCPGVLRAVEEFHYRNRNFFKLSPLTGQCVLVKD